MARCIQCGHDADMHNTPDVPLPCAQIVIVHPGPGYEEAYCDCPGFRPAPPRCMDCGGGLDGGTREVADGRCAACMSAYEARCEQWPEAVSGPNPAQAGDAATKQASDTRRMP